MDSNIEFKIDEQLPVEIILLVAPPPAEVWGCSKGHEKHERHVGYAELPRGVSWSREGEPLLGPFCYECLVKFLKAHEQEIPKLVKLVEVGEK